MSQDCPKDESDSRLIGEGALSAYSPDDSSRTVPNRALGCVHDARPEFQRPGARSTSSGVADVILIQRTVSSTNQSSDISRASTGAIKRSYVTMYALTWMSVT